MGMITDLLLLLLSFFAIFFAVGVLYSREVVHVVIYIAGLFIDLGGLYIVLSSPYVGAVQIFVYGGAVTVLLMFGVMLTKRTIKEKKEKIVTQFDYAVIVALLVSLYVGALFSYTNYPTELYYIGYYSLSNNMFGTYIGTFVLLGIVIMAAVIGGVYIVKEEDQL